MKLQNKIYLSVLGILVLISFLVLLFYYTQDFEEKLTFLNSINYKDIEMLEIPVPSIAKQHKLVEKYETGLEMYKSKIEQAEQEWSIIIKEVQDNLF